MHNTSSSVCIQLIHFAVSLSIVALLCTTHTHSIDSDTLIFIDFRADRMRQIVEALGIRPQFQTDAIPRDLVHTRTTSPF